MKSTAKWLVVGGAFLLIIVFFLPVMSVPSATENERVSLLNLASNFFVLYLFPLAALTTLILALVPSSVRVKNSFLLIGQAGALGLGLIILVGTLVYFFFWTQDPEVIASLLPPECQTQPGCKVLPGIGFFVLILGYGLVAFGWVANFFPLFDSLTKKHAVQTATPKSLSPQEQIGEVVASGPRLEFKKGKLADQIILIKGDNFSVGRGRDNDLQLQDPDRKISRVHAQLRFAQDAWFIQDQGSKIGTFVNAKPVKASRLSSGDEIRIGENTFIFRM